MMMMAKPESPNLSLTFQHVSANPNDYLGLLIM